MKDPTPRAMRFEDHLKALRDTGITERMSPFRQDFDTFRKLYNSLDIRVLAYFANNRWINVASQFILSPRAVPANLHVKRTKLTEGLLLLRANEDVNNIWKYIDTLIDGTLFLDKKQIYLQKDGSTLKYYPSVRNIDASHARDILGLPYQTSILEWHGDSIASTINEFGRLEKKLASLNKPMEGLHDVIESNLYYKLPSMNTWSNTIGFVQFLAPAYVGFSGKIRTNKHKLSVGISVEDKKKIDISQLSVGIKTDKGIRKTIKGNQLNVTSARGGYFLEFDDLGTSKECTLFLKMFGSEVDRIRLEPPRLAFSSHIRELFGNWKKEVKKLKSAITKENEIMKDDVYEKYIARLFTMMGFICNPLGLIAPNSDAPDGIAVFPDSNNIVIYECTIGAPGTRKLDKLAARTNKLRTRCSTFNFHSVMFSNAKLTELTETQKEIALKSEITIVDNVGILELIEKMSDGIEEKDILNWFSIQRIRAFPFNALS